MARRPTAARSNESMTAIRLSIATTLGAWSAQPLAQGALALLNCLGYHSERMDSGFPAQPQAFVRELSEASGYVLDPAKIQLDRWQRAELLCQLSDEDVTLLAQNQRALLPDTRIALSQIESFLFVAIELADQEWSRTALTSIVRELNRTVQMPLIILFRYGKRFSLAVISRRLHKRDAERDVLGSKITVIKDVRLDAPHTAHIHILASLELSVLQDQQPIADFNDLYAAWLRQLSIKALNERFYKELQNWYLWARREVTFPKGQTLDEEGRPSVAVIRLLTRLIFVWFIKEKGLVPEDFFVGDHLSTLLKDDPRTNLNANNYYLAILQNLFFATLNVEMGKNRQWASSDAAAFQGKQKDRLVHGVYRYAELFRDAEQAKLLFDQVPFLNGGLFECLDRELLNHDLNNFELVKRANREGQSLVLRVDGFSRRSEVQPQVPNKIFFGHGENVDLNDELNTKGKQYKADGLLDIFGRYKFTVDENTALDEEVALDPELLGKVFENLLASYNEDTKTTARKQSGSFYTPREVVDYMVDEAIIAYVLPKISDRSDEAVLRSKLKSLLSYQEVGNPFDVDETTSVMMQLAELKILDPACGSGAFPMGALNKLVWALSKLDPDNQLWRREHERRLSAQLVQAKQADNSDEVQALDAELKRLKDNFEKQTAEYTRKLYLIEHSIYGVDIQPIAVQIAKLRFFIALIVSQKVNPNKANLGMLALPNLETRIVAANGLQPLFDHGQEVIESEHLQALRKQLVEQQARYFRANTRDKKKTAQNKIEALQQQIQQECFLLGYGDGTSGRLLSFRPFDQNSSSQFFEPSIMFGFDKFNLVIGNPPYVQVKRGAHNEAFYPYSVGKDKGKQNLYKIFVEASYNYVAKGDVVCLIVQSSLMCDLSASGTRELILDRCQLHQVLEFPKKSSDPKAQVFEGVLQGTCIVLFSKGDSRADHEFKISVDNHAYSLYEPSFESIGKSFIFDFYPDILYIPLIGKGCSKILSSIRDVSTPFEVFIDHSQSGQGDLNLTAAKSYISLSKTNTQLYRGKHVHRFWMDAFSTEYITSGYLLPSQKFNLKNIFLCFQEVTGTTDEYRIHCCVHNNSNNRILFGHTVNKIVLCDQELSYFMCGIFNSSLMDWFFRLTSTNNHVCGYELDLMPIPRYTDRQFKVLHQISFDLSSLLQSVSTKLTALSLQSVEKLINGLVYELFFTKDAHAAGVHLFDTCTQIGLDDIDALAQHPTVLAQLATIHSLPDVQLIERSISA